MKKTLKTGRGWKNGKYVGRRNPKSKLTYFKKMWTGSFPGEDDEYKLKKTNPELYKEIMSSKTWKSLFKILGEHGCSVGDVWDTSVDVSRGDAPTVSDAIEKNLKVHGHYLKQEKGVFELPGKYLSK